MVKRLCSVWWNDREKAAKEMGRSVELMDDVKSMKEKWMGGEWREIAKMLIEV